MLAFLRRSTSVKPSPETTPSTPSCKTSVCSDTAAGDNSAESHSEECGGLSECIQEADVQEARGKGGARGRHTQQEIRRPVQDAD